MSEFVSLVRRLETSAARLPDAEAVVHGTRRVSYGHLWRDVCAFAGFLHCAGIRPGDRVAVLLENSAEYVAAYYGTLAAGAVAVGLNASARARELNCWLDHCGAKVIVANPRYPDFESLLDRQRAGLQIVAVTDHAAAGTIRWSEALQRPMASPADVSDSSPAALIYTSGTTGRPKGVALTHGNFSANTSAIIRYLRLTSADRVLNLLPFFYSYGSSVLHTHLAVGGTLVLENHFVYPQLILSRMADENVTGFPGVPSTFALLLQCRDLRGEDLPSLRYMTQAGGAMPPANVARLRERLPHVELFVMYGQTEATARLTYVPPQRLEAKLGSAGIPLDGVSLRICGEDGSNVPAGHVGEVCVRGPNVMSGYFRDPDATAQVLRDGWLHTGDLGHLDADGYLYLLGRRSDMIKSGAHRISPLDIEEVIARLPDVAEVAVVGIPDAILGEAIKAVVRPRVDGVLDALSIQRHCIRELPRYKVPKVVEFASVLPRTTSGKIMRYKLTSNDHTTLTN